MSTDVPEEVQATYRRLALAVSKAPEDRELEQELATVEAQIASHSRIQARAAAAASEASVVAEALEVKRAERAALAMREAHLKLVTERQTAYLAAEKAVDAVCIAIRAALAAGDAVHNSALGLQLPPPRAARYVFEDFTGQALFDAGLKGFPMTRASLRQKPSEQ